MDTDLEPADPELVLNCKVPAWNRMPGHARIAKPALKNMMRKTEQVWLKRLGSLKQILRWHSKADESLEELSLIQSILSLGHQEECRREHQHPRLKPQTGMG